MKKFFTLMTAVVLLSSAAEAKNWRINNDPAAKADFLSIDAAMASTDVYAGDVLYLDPGCRLPAQTISKGVTIIGTGYNLKETEEAMVAGITIKANDIKLTGINVSGRINWPNNYSSFHNITIERCKFQGLITHDYSSSSEYKCYGVKIIGCYVTGDINGGRANSPLTVRNSIILGRVGSINNGIITNNVIIYSTGTSTNNNQSFPLNYTTNSTITNNIIINPTTHTTTTDNVVTNWSHQTIYNTAITDYNTITNNVLSTDEAHAWVDFPTNKFIGAKVEDIFVNEGNQEEKYQLKEDSPAKGYAPNGEDCGAFGGLYPYVLCGRPQFVPYIYDAQIPNTPTDGKLNITLKIKSQNE